ncbi:MAG: pyridoxal-phosphate dependent enzyme [Bernardetiaceae bacterium]|nr:pyridoxal-phosphate dependent enzyme [Bernardetiaceae bacterium]
MLSPPIILPHTSISLRLLRLDRLHLPIGGNKYFKLKYNLEEAKNQNYSTLLTFGGAYSNHILATARAAQAQGFESIGIIRGEAHAPLNKVLQAAKEAGMQLHYINRSMYKLKHTKEVKEKLKQAFGGFYLIPEGGTNLEAVRGASEIPKLIAHTVYDTLLTPVGTGGTLAGLAIGLPPEKQLEGIAVLKGADFLKTDTHALINDFQKKYPAYSHAPLAHWNLQTDYHFGGYAKTSSSLNAFIQRFYLDNQILIEPIYTGKMMYAIADLAQKQYFKSNSRLIALHTGGLDYLPSSN